jgi:hypothetical protein
MWFKTSLYLTGLVFAAGIVLGVCGVSWGGVLATAAVGAMMIILAWAMEPWLLVAILALAWSGVASADTTTVDLSQVGNQVLTLILAGIGVGLSWIVKRGVVALEAIHLLQSGQVHGDVIDAAVADAVSWATTRLEAIADPIMKVQMATGIMAEAAQMVVTSAPAAIDALGLTPDAVAAKIKLALGNPMAGAPAPAIPPVPVAVTLIPPAPVVQPGSIVQAGTLGLALLIMLITPACTPAEVASASADFKEGCSDWNAAKGIVGEGGEFLPSPLNQVAAVTETFVGDACDDADFVAKAGPEQATWIKTSAANLRAVAAQAGK